MRCGGQKRGGRPIIERLEERQLLSLAQVADLPLIIEATGSSSPTGYTPTQIRDAYGLAGLSFNSTAASGAGQTIAIIGAYDNPDLVSSSNSAFDSSDLHKFDVEFGLADPPSFTKVNESGGSNYPPASSSWTMETDLDVEWSHAMAPQANIILVEAASASFDDLLTKALIYADNISGVSVISMSFGETESAMNTSYNSDFTTPSGHTPITFVASTGDSAAPGTYPAMSPNVVAAGGTTLTLSGNSYVSEKAWNDGGGGISEYESKPSYQSAISLSSSQRMIPDVAFDADPNTGVAIYDAYSSSSSPWFKVGGTSVSAPSWAGIFADVDQGRTLASLGTLNGRTQTLPDLYTMGSSNFHDITSGSDGYSAGVGYDLATGLGSPIANVLVPDLAGGDKASGMVFNDANGNGVLNSGETGISGVTVYVDLNNNGKLDTGEPFTTTNSSGNFTLTDLPAGAIILRQIVPSGYKQTDPTNNYGQHVTAGSTPITGANFGDSGGSDAVITGVVFDDANGNGVQDSGEAGLSGWTVYIDLNNSDTFVSGDPTTTTNSSGDFTFDLPAGAYIIRVLPETGWNQRYPVDHYGDHLTVTSGENVTNVRFGEEEIG